MSHTRFCGRNSVVTSSTDGAIACWDLSSKDPADPADVRTAHSATSGAADSTGSSNSGGGSCTQDFVNPYSVHRGHVHNYNFVGLSVRPVPAGTSGSKGSCAPGSFIASGSQDGRAVAYSDRQEGQLASWRLDGSSLQGGWTGHHSGVIAFSGGNQGGALHAIGSRPGVPSKSHAHRPHPLGKPYREQTPFAKSNSSCEFVSAVAWAPIACTASEAPLLAVASSDGNATVLQLQQ